MPSTILEGCRGPRAGELRMRGADSQHESGAETVDDSPMRTGELRRRRLPDADDPIFMSAGAQSSVFRSPNAIQQRRSWSVLEVGGGPMTVTE